MKEERKPVTETKPFNTEERGRGTGREERGAGNKKNFEKQMKQKEMKEGWREELKFMQGK